MANVLKLLSYFPFLFFDNAFEENSDFTDYDSGLFKFKSQSFGPIWRRGSGFSSSEGLKNNNRIENTDRCWVSEWPLQFIQLRIFILNHVVSPSWWQVHWLCIELLKYRVIFDKSKPKFYILKQMSVPVAYPGILCGGSTNSVEDRENEDLGGGSPLVRGSEGSCNLVQEISFHMVKFS